MRKQDFALEPAWSFDEPKCPLKSRKHKYKLKNPTQKNF